jgi:hypothetical protein
MLGLALLQGKQYGNAISELEKVSHVGFSIDFSHFS